MRYNISTQTIPQEQRALLNAACIKQARYNLRGDEKLLTKANIFSVYSGHGAISGVERKKHSSFSDFIRAKRDEEQGQFFTSIDSANTITSILGVEKHATLFDPTCGIGVFANNVESGNFTGVEKDEEVFTIASYLFNNQKIINCDILNFNQEKKFDYVVANPPFNLKFGNKTAQNYILEKSVIWTKKYGFIVLIVPDTYLMDDFYYSAQIKFINENLNFLGAYKMKNAFAAYDLKYPVKVLFFQNCQGREFDNNTMSDDYTNHLDIKNEIAALKIDRKKYTVSTLSDSLNENDFSFKLGQITEELAFPFVVKKLLFEIKTHQGEEKYTKAIYILNEFANQQQPPTVSSEEWQKIKLTKPKVIFRLKQIIGLKKKRKGERFRTIVDPNQLTKYKDIVVSEEVKNYVNNCTLKNHGGKSINPLWYQSEDIVKILSKPYSLVGHQQGLGKTITSFVWAEYTHRKKCLVFPKVVEKDWLSFLKANKKSFVIVKTPSDIKKDVDYYIFTTELLARTIKRNKAGDNTSKFGFRQIKKYMKSFDFDVIVDECQDMNDYTSNTYKAVRNLFVSAKRKLCMSGTVISNNVAEYFPLIDFLYNGTYINNCENWYIEQKVKGEPNKIIKTKNDKIGQPFKSYKGFSDFKRCFCPAKKSVFGISKQNQDIYNETELINLLDTVLLIRKFKDIAADKYNINHILINPTFDEKMLHEDILEQTGNYIRAYYDSTGNSRKDSALRIIRQLNLLIETTIYPERFEELKGELIPNY